MECKILHIFDDAIISKSTIELFKKIKGFDQKFAVITSSNGNKLDNTSDSHSIILLKNGRSLADDIAAIIENYDIIIFQALSFEKAKAMLQKKFSSKVFIWGLWGYELYNVVDY